MKTKLLIFTWLITLTILTLALVLHVKENTAKVNELQNYYINTEDRVLILESDFEHNQGRVEEAIKEWFVEEAIQDWFNDRRIIPVGRGVLLAVETEEESE